MYWEITVETGQGLPAHESSLDAYAPCFLFTELTAPIRCFRGFKLRITSTPCVTFLVAVGVAELVPGWVAQLWEVCGFVVRAEEECTDLEAFSLVFFSSARNSVVTSANLRSPAAVSGVCRQ